MTQEYPKALYKGSKAIYNTKIAENEEHEQELRDSGYVDFVDLNDVQIDTTTPQTINDLKEELLNALNAKKELQEQLDTAQGEFIAFQNDVLAMRDRIAEIQGIPMDIDPVDTVDNAEPVESLPTHYADMTSEQLREEIKKVGKSFNVRASKAKLIEILEG